MPGQKIRCAAGKLAANDRIGWWTERRLNLMLAPFLETFDLIKAAPSDDADCWLVYVHAHGDYSEGEKVGKRILRFVMPRNERDFSRASHCRSASSRRAGLLRRAE